LTDYARWWQRRERLAWSARVTDARLELQARKGADDMTVIVEQDGRYAALPAATGTHPLAALKGKTLPAPVPFDPHSLATRQPSLLLRARSFQRKVQKNLQGHRG
jgi:hypothetical protein